MMKTYISTIMTVLAAALLFTSCNDYLNEKPKGKKIPATLADYEAFLRDEYDVHRMDAGQSAYLLNDRYLTNSDASYYPMYAANYNWDTAVDRVYYNNSDETTYYAAYSGINYCNLVIENAPTATEATDAKKNEVVAYAKVLRTMHYFLLANYYADTYQSSSAAETLSVPLITSSEVGASYTQVTVKQIYNFMINDLTEAIPYLPDMGTTVLHPGKGAAYAMLARIYLQMMDYTDALEYANKALAINDKLIDWNDFYNANKSVIDAESSAQTSQTPLGFNSVESYNFNYGSSSSGARINNMPQWRAKMFEDDDIYFKCNWKLYTVGSETYYRGITTGTINYNGMRTVEQYLIKAECLARDNQLTEAMNVLNTVRKHTVSTDKYESLAASSVAEAIEYICREKDNLLIYSIVPFADARRYNAEGIYTRTLSKEKDGKTVTLSPSSYMWTFPFPQGAIKNAGNGSITQNVEK